MVALRPVWPVSFQEDKYFYFVIVLVAVSLILAANNIVKSKFGRAFITVQKDEIISKSNGINLTRVQDSCLPPLQFFWWSCRGFTALVGFLTHLLWDHGIGLLYHDGRLWWPGDDIRRNYRSTILHYCTGVTPRSKILLGTRACRDLSLLSNLHGLTESWDSLEVFLFF